MPRLRSLKLAGFRSFGDQEQELSFEGPCALVSGANSQGKTSIAEAVEFLLTGQTVRRELLGGAKAEYDRSLRNVHLPADAPVWVEAEFEDTEGNVRAIRRDLVTDYTAQDDCTSRLTVDGEECHSLDSIGITLAEPPLRAPVLLQHSLRFALSARPGDRAEYFKSVVEVADLESFRDAVASTKSAVTTPDLPDLRLLARCAAIPEMDAVCGSLTQGTPRPDRTRELLRDALGIALVATGTASADLPPGHDERRDALGAVLAKQREEQVSLLPFRITPLPERELTVPVAAARDYIAAKESVDAEVRRLQGLFEAVLSVPEVGSATGALDCPVCETESALTVERIQAIRRQVEANSDFADKRAQARRLLAELPSMVERAAVQDLPGITSWGDDDWSEAADSLKRFRVTDETLGAIRESSADIASAAGTFETARQSLAASATTAANTLDELTVQSVDALEVAMKEARDAREALESALATTRALVDPMLEAVTREVDAASDLTKWADVHALAADPAALTSALKEQQRIETVRREIDEALAQIDQAKSSLFDTRFSSISTEIRGWWELLRPDEHVRFDEVRRRGTGRRFVDFKAVLAAELGGDEVERDALGVFSDSQLNALGLAAFLARCEKQKVPFVVLDEPVQAGDQEHRMTFVRKAMERLLENGTQVIVTSYDDQLMRLMNDLHRHAPLDSFSISLGSRTAGTEITKTSNPVTAELAAAAMFIRHDEEAMRDVGAKKLRPTAERLAKEIILKGRRSASETCDITEYQGKTLGDLLPLLEPHLNSDEERGKWRAIKTVLNPSHHDDEVPAANALKTALGDLSKSAKDHAVQ